MEINPAELDRRSLYRLMTGCVVPRPIGWISTVDLEGRRNLAPFSYFTAASSDPPYVLFCPALVREGKMKDTLRNVRQTGEFVVNLVTEELAQAMNVSAIDYPPEIDEFEAAGLTPGPSVEVKAFRVAESPVHFECKLEQIIGLGTDPGSGNIVIGRVVHFQVDDAVLLDGFTIDILGLKPIGRLAGAGYCRVRDLFQMPRIRYASGSD